MSSVYGMIMEQEWFPRFILICKDLLRRMNEHEEEYRPVKAICHCESYRQVLSNLKAYNNDDFENLIHTQQVLAKKAVTRERQ